MLDLLVDYLCSTSFVGAFKLAIILDEIMTDIVSEAVEAYHMQAFIQISKFFDIVELSWVSATGSCAQDGLIVVHMILKRIIYPVGFID